MKRSASPVIRAGVGFGFLVALAGLLLYLRRPMFVARVENATGETVTMLSVRSSMGTLEVPSLEPGGSRAVVLRGYGEGSYLVRWRGADGKERKFSCGYYHVLSKDSYIDIRLRLDKADHGRCSEGDLSFP